MKTRVVMCLLLAAIVGCTPSEQPEGIPLNTQKTTEGTNRVISSSAASATEISKIFVKPMSQDAAYEKFRGKLVFAVLRRRYLTWVADGGITVNLDVPKKPNWYAGQGEVFEIEARGKIAEILFKERHLTIECEPDDIRVLAVE